MGSDDDAISPQMWASGVTSHFPTQTDPMSRKMGYHVSFLIHTEREKALWVPFEIDRLFRSNMDLRLHDGQKELRVMDRIVDVTGPCQIRTSQWRKGGSKGSYCDGIASAGRSPGSTV